MKKKTILCTLVLLTASICFTFTDEVGSEPVKTATDVYDFTMFAYVPRTYDNTESKGFRKYQRQTIKGELVIDYFSDYSYEVSLTNVVNKTHRIKGVNVEYKCGVYDASISLTGSNFTQLFKVSTCKFTVEMQPSYVWGYTPTETEQPARPRISRIYSTDKNGKSSEIFSQVNTNDGRPEIFGLPRGEGRAIASRISSALRQSGYDDISNFTTDIQGENVSSRGMDLPIALSVLASAGKAGDSSQDYGAIGRLSMDGSVNSVGIGSVIDDVLEMRRMGKGKVFVPEDKIKEASMVEGVDVYPIRTLREAGQAMNGELDIRPVYTKPGTQPQILLDYWKGKGYDVENAKVDPTTGITTLKDGKTLKL